MLTLPWWKKNHNLSKRERERERERESRSTVELRVRRQEDPVQVRHGERDGTDSIRYDTTGDSNN